MGLLVDQTSHQDAILRQQAHHDRACCQEAVGTGTQSIHSISNTVQLLDTLKRAHADDARLGAVFDRYDRMIAFKREEEK